MVAHEFYHDIISYKKRSNRCLMHLLQRDARRKRGLCCRPMSERLSNTFVYCIQMAEDIVKLLSRPGSAIILVFDPIMH